MQKQQQIYYTKKNFKKCNYDDFEELSKFKFLRIKTKT